MNGSRRPAAPSIFAGTAGLGSVLGASTWATLGLCGTGAATGLGALLLLETATGLAGLGAGFALAFFAGTGLTEGLAAE